MKTVDTCLNSCCECGGLTYSEMLPPRRQRLRVNVTHGQHMQLVLVVTPYLQHVVGVSTELV
jgi:hypothetical protein